MNESDMRAVVVRAPGGAEQMALQRLPQPVPGHGEVLIRVHAAGINRPDVLQRKGLYPPPPGASPLLGLEVAGTIVGGDPAAGGFALGDAVCALVPGGGYAEYCVTSAQHCLPVPRGWSMVEAASLPETCFTVWSNVFDRARLGYRADGVPESLLVQGGTSGIGVTAIQMAAALGHPVYATAGTADKVQACEALGATRGIHYRDEDFLTVIRDITADRGVDVILDMVAGDYLAREIRALADDGRLVFIALLGGARAELDMSQVLRRRLTITGSTLRPRSVAYKADVARHLRERIWPLIEAGKIKPVVFAEFAIDDVAQAHELMESSTHVGKIVLRVSTDS